MGHSLIVLLSTLDAEYSGPGQYIPGPLAAAPARETRRPSGSLWASSETPDIAQPLQRLRQPPTVTLAGPRSRVGGPAVTPGPGCQSVSESAGDPWHDPGVGRRRRRVAGAVAPSRAQNATFRSAPKRRRSGNGRLPMPEPPEWYPIGSELDSNSKKISPAACQSYFWEGTWICHARAPE